MAEEEEVEMEDDEGSQGAVPFQLQFDKPIHSQVKIAEWNPEKDLLAMVTEDNKFLLHRFNWQRLWSSSPGKNITSLCWRPDGKAVALGLGDGTISLHDVENGKLLRAIKTHGVAVISLNWQEVAQTKPENDLYTYEDRMLRFFPTAPRIPQAHGLGSDGGLTEDSEASFQELSSCSYQHFNILCSGDKDGCICFNAFGIFLMGKINLRNLPICNPDSNANMISKLHNASIQKVALSKTLSQMIVLCSGELVDNLVMLKDGGPVEVDKSYLNLGSSAGLHCLLLNTSIFLSRKNELHQVAQQASNINHLIDVIRESLSLMSKQWSNAMNSFNEKFNILSSLIISHGGADLNPQDEFLSLLFGTRTSSPIHQFLMQSLGEAGLKRVSKAIFEAGKELHAILYEHLQPAIEIIVFRAGELRGLSKWRSRFRNIGLDEALIDKAIEKTGMLFVQLVRFSKVLAVVIQLFQNFFNWILKCIKTLVPEPTDQIPQPNSEHVVLFLKYFYDQDPVGQFLEHSDRNLNIVSNPDTKKQIEDLRAFGGFSDAEFLERTLSKEFNQLEQCFKDAFLMPFATVSKKIYCEDFMPLYPSPSSAISKVHTPASIYYYKGDFDGVSICEASQPCPLDYVCFILPDISLEMANCIGILKGLARSSTSVSSLAAILLRIPEGYKCADLSLYKENQLLLLLRESTLSFESPERSWMMLIQMNSLPFVSISRASQGNLWPWLELKDSAVDLNLSTGKVRCIPHMVTSPLAVSVSRGVASIFSSRKHALVYILDEYEDEISAME